MSLIRRLSRLPLLALVATPTFADVRVVAPSGAPYTTIQAAVNSAVDGDVVLVRPGTYAGFTVSDKALDVVADSGAGVVQINGHVLVLSLAATRTCTLSGFRIDAATTSPALRFAFNAGAVRAQGCQVTGRSMPCGTYFHGGPALDVDVSSDVVLSRCSFLGGDGGHVADEGGYGGFGGDGATPTQSRVAFYDCSSTGGRGGGVDPAACGATTGYGYAGGDAGDFVGCPVVFASGSTFTGGAPPPGLAFAVGDGAQLAGFPPYGECHAWWLGSSFVGATPILVYGQASSNPLAGTPRRLVARSLAREGELVRLRFEGNPGDRVELFVADAPRFAFATGWRGVLSVRSRGTPVMQAGTIPPSGVLEIPWTIGDLGPGASSKRLLMQPSFVDSSGQATLGTPHTLVLLDAAF